MVAGQLTSAVGRQKFRAKVFRQQDPVRLVLEHRSVRTFNCRALPGQAEPGRPQFGFSVLPRTAFEMRVAPGLIVKCVADGESAPKFVLLRSAKGEAGTRRKRLQIFDVPRCQRRTGTVSPFKSASLKRRHRSLKRRYTRYAKLRPPSTW